MPNTSKADTTKLNTMMIMNNIKANILSAEHMYTYVHYKTLKFRLLISEYSPF